MMRFAAALGPITEHCQFTEDIARPATSEGNSMVYRDRVVESRKSKATRDRVWGKTLHRRSFSAGISAALLTAVAGRPAIAASSNAADFYRGRTVRILVGSPPGGGYDLYARLMRPYLAAKIGATVLVENRDGQGGLAALATLMVRPADGLTIMHASAEAAILSQMLARPGVTWDVTKLNWLAKTSMAPKLWYVGPHARYPTIKDATSAAVLTWSSTGPADNISDIAAIISYVLSLNSKIVVGYRGAGDMWLAVLRNEVDAGILSADTALPQIRNNSIKPIAIFSARRWHHLPDVPTLSEAVALPDDKSWIVKLRQRIGEAQRAMVAAPNVPADRVDFLRNAFAEVLADPALIAEGVKTNREIEYMGGRELQQLVGQLMTAAGPRLPEFRKIVLESYF
jgi:tripartite-type tricarboxylate transporter receptor subunit TctC